MVAAVLVVQVVAVLGLLLALGVTVHQIQVVAVVAVQELVALVIQGEVVAQEL
jgi:hypothetical protein